MPSAPLPPPPRHVDHEVRGVSRESGRHRDVPRGRAEQSENRVVRACNARAEGARVERGRRFGERDAEDLTFDPKSGNPIPMAARKSPKTSLNLRKALGASEETSPQLLSLYIPDKDSEGRKFGAQGSSWNSTAVSTASRSLTRPEPGGSHGQDHRYQQFSYACG